MAEYTTQDYINLIKQGRSMKIGLYAMEKLVDYIESLECEVEIDESILRKKWIKCSDWLPNKDMSVFVYCTHIEIHHWGGIQRTKYVRDDFWHNKDKMFCLYKREWSTWYRFKKSKHRVIITHWWKQPDPPKKGE